MAKSSAMVPIYGNLIIKGLKAIDDVPEALRDDVRQWLADHGYGAANEE